MFKKFKKNNKGNIAIMGALMLVPTIMGMGIAVDVSNLVYEKSRLQDAVDNATLAAIKARDGRRADGTAIRAFRKTMQDAGYSDARLTKYRYRVRNGEVKVETSARFQYKPSFATVLGVKNLRVNAATSVVGPLKVTGVNFRPTFGSGYLHKDFRLYVNRPGSSMPERLATYTWRSSAPVTFPNGSSPGNLSSDPWGTIDLGDYEDFFFTVTVTDPWNTYQHEQIVEVYGEDYTIVTNEPGKGDHFVVNGRTLPRNEQVDFSREISCENPNQNFEWEDAPELAEEGTDFRFVVTARCNGIDLNKIRIAR